MSKQPNPADDSTADRALRKKAVLGESDRFVILAAAFYQDSNRPIWHDYPADLQHSTIVFRLGTAMGIWAAPVGVLVNRITELIELGCHPENVWFWPANFSTALAKRNEAKSLRANGDIFGWNPKVLTAAKNLTQLEIKKKIKYAAFDAVASSQSGGQNQKQTPQLQAHNA